MFSGNSHEIAGGTGAAGSQVRNNFPIKPTGLSTSEWRAMCLTLSLARAASGAVPPDHSVNNSCAAPPLLDEYAEEYSDKNYDSYVSGSCLIVPLSHYYYTR